MADVTWRCEHPTTGDVKMAAKEEHKQVLEDQGFTCEVYADEHWTGANIPPSPPAPSVVYSTWNPLRTDSQVVLSGDNLTVTDTIGDDDRNTRSTAAHSTGKRYFEIKVNSILYNDGWAELGMYPESMDMPFTDYPGLYYGWCVELQNWDNQYAEWKTPGGPWSSPDFPWWDYEPNMVVGVAVDLDAKQVRVRANNGPLAGQFINGGAPILTYTDDGPMNVLTTVVAASLTANFGQHDFVMPLPAGYTAWDT